MRKRNITKRIVSLVLAVTSCCTCILAGSATNYSNYPILGSYEDQDDPVDAGLKVYLADEATTYAEPRSTWQLFTMEAKKVTSLLTTSAAGKAFKKSDLEHGGLLIQGSFEYALSGRKYDVRCGACVYENDTGYFRATHAVEGTTIFEIFPESDFSKYNTYYGFVQNILTSEVDTVAGRLTFYDTNDVM